MKRFIHQLFEDPKLAFTLIEILVVVTIIGLLLSGGIVSYSQLSKNSRDAKRKFDLQQVRGALEMYRSNNNNYPLNINTLVTGDANSIKYIDKIPTDPLGVASQVYLYRALPNPSCNNTTIPCTDYTFGAYIEVAGSSCGGGVSPGNCKLSPATSCNYCLGTYGEK